MRPEDKNPGAPTPASAGQAPLAQMSVRALITRLAVLEDRITSETATGGSVPGHIPRMAALQRRVRLIHAELARRHTTDLNSHDTDTDTVT